MPKARQPSTAYTIAFIVIGGAVGLLAGYGALSLIRPPTVAVSEQAQPAIKSSPRELRTEKPRRPASLTRTDQAPVIRERPQKVQPPERLAPVAPLPGLPCGPNSAEVAAVERFKNQRPKPQPPKASDQPAPGKPSAIVPLTFEKTAIRVIAIPENVPVNSLLCDVALSENLLNRSSAAGGDHTIIAEKLGNRGKYTAELAAGIANCTVAIDIAVSHRNNAAICELRPRLLLPSGDVEQLTISRGSRLHKQLAKLLENATAARRDLPAMRDEFRQLENRARELQQMMNGQGSNPGETAAGRITAQAELNRLGGTINRARKSIANAEQLVRDESAIKAELIALEKIGKYAKELASVATVSVRFYSGDVTIPATAK